MNNRLSKIFTGHEAALAYALTAERICAGSADFLNDNPSVVPIFVNLLFQSLEISIKQAGIISNLFTEREARDRDRRSGHGINELARLAIERLGGETCDPLIMAMAFASTNSHSSHILREMICGENFNKTRDAYASRGLGYGEVREGDFAIIEPVAEWIEVVKETATNLPAIIDILSQWKTSDSHSRHFAIWINNRG